MKSAGSLGECSKSNWADRLLFKDDIPYSGQITVSPILRGAGMKSNKKNKMQVKSRAGRKEERTAYLCLIPAFLGVSLISYLPTLAVFVLSVFKWNGLSSPEFVGMDNFQRIFTKDIYFTDSIKATILYKNYFARQFIKRVSY